MKKKILTAMQVTFVILVWTAFSHAANGTLRVTSFPNGAEVLVDGVSTGKVTPMNISLAQGDHSVTVRISGGGWQEDTRTVTIVAGNNDLSVTLLPTLTQGPPGIGFNPLQVAILRWYDAISGLQFTVEGFPMGVAFDGANIWVSNQGNHNVMKLRASDGALLGTFTVGTGPNYVASDGANIWVSNTGSGNVTKLRASDGANLGSFAVGNDPTGVAFDGANIWVANTPNNTVSKR
ncbi:MAG: PEGA domain-containing protein [Acidobacteria bacterium]|nr:PEGA domain-containing protein [Acidobacteriota bacterium]